MSNEFGKLRGVNNLRFETKHTLYLQKVYWILGGNNLWHELRDDDDDDTGEEPGLQERRLEPHGRQEQEPFPGLQVDRCQFNRKENKKYYEDLSPHQKSFHIVAWPTEKQQIVKVKKWVY